MKKEEKYLSQIIELCKEKKAPLVFVTTPTAHREDEQPYYNTVSDIFDDYWTDNAHVNTIRKNFIRES